MTTTLNTFTGRITVGPRRVSAPVSAPSNSLRVTVNGGRVPEFFKERGTLVTGTATVCATLIFERNHHMMARLLSSSSTSFDTTAPQSASLTATVTNKYTLQRTVNDTVVVKGIANISNARRLSISSNAVDTVMALVEKAGREAVPVKGRRAAHAIKTLADSASVISTQSNDISAAPGVETVRIDAPVWVGGAYNTLTENAPANTTADAHMHGSKSLPADTVAPAATSSLVVELPLQAFLRTCGFVTNALGLSYKREVVPLVATAIAILARNRNYSSGTSIAAVAVATTGTRKQAVAHPTTTNTAAVVRSGVSPVSSIAGASATVGRVREATANLSVAVGKHFTLTRSDIVRMAASADALHTDVFGPPLQRVVGGASASASAETGKLAPSQSVTTASVTAQAIRPVRQPVYCLSVAIPASGLAKSATVVPAVSLSTTVGKPAATTSIPVVEHVRASTQDYFLEDFAEGLYTGTLRVLQ